MASGTASTPEQHKAMKAIQGQGWESPCVHPAGGYTADESGLARCGQCGAGWTVEGGRKASDLCHLYALLYGDLRMCGCGNPDDAYDLVRDLLALMPLFEDGHRDAARSVVGGGEGTFHLVLSMLDGARLIEHGSSVLGSWLTPKGRHYLELMRRYTMDDLDIDGEDTDGALILVGFPHDGNGCPKGCPHEMASGNA